MSDLEDYITKPIIAEAIASWQAVLFYSELGHQLVEFEGDAL